MENRTWFLFSKKLSGEATVAEIGELNDLLSQHPHLHEELAAFEQYWHTPNTAPDAQELDQAYARLLQRMKASHTAFPATPPATLSEASTPAVSVFRRKTARWAMTAAAAMLAVALWFWPQAETEPATKAEQLAQQPQVSTRPGSRTKIVLPDGTQVWLNADSKLTYANDFGNTSRDVKLIGEAYFEVVPNKKVPFHIITEKMRIKVTGTAFNVRAYPNETRSETSLVHGRVEVTVASQPDKTYYLKPSEKLVVMNDAPVLTSTEIPTAADPRIIIPKEKVMDPMKVPMVLDKDDLTPIDIAWVHNKLAFESERFRDVANKMEKWYGVQITFLNKELEEERLRGSFIDESIQEALEYLQLACKFKYTIKGNQITIQ